MEAEQLEMDDSLKDLAEAWDAAEGEDSGEAIDQHGESDSGLSESGEPASGRPESEVEQPADSELVSGDQAEVSGQADNDPTEKPPVSWNAEAR